MSDRETPTYRVGLDIGSTTVKAVVTDDNDEEIFSRYQRHGSDIRSTLIDLLEDLISSLGDISASVAMTGSGALAISKLLSVYFIQEVAATAIAIKKHIPKTTVSIELGGEDAKMIFFGKYGNEYSMNDACAGGTGAFIDQMAVLMGATPDDLNDWARLATKSITIPSRCGVFAKNELQPLINQGEDRGDLSRGIFDAVARQVISNLSQGRTIKPTDCVAFLGGPLSFMDELRGSFIRQLKLPEDHTCCPLDAKTFIAFGASQAAASQPAIQLGALLAKVKALEGFDSDLHYLPQLFSSSAELEDFRAAHSTHLVQRDIIPGEPIYVGFDAGSTTVKAVAIGSDKAIVASWYFSNEGKLPELAAKIMAELEELQCPVEYSVATGYGEKFFIDRHGVNSGEVETIAHLRAAQYLAPDVSFILDIGGKDMKAMKVKNGALEHIILNEACSSGCGSFIETYAKSLGLSLEEFCAQAALAEKPINLGTRCTVFMNSNIKQAQKNGAPLADIAAGLSYSVVKNALYKVIKLHSASELGKKVVVQGGTFLNDSILRAFEIETGTTAIRPEAAGLMGAFGAALIALDRAHGAPIATSVQGLSNQGYSTFDVVEIKRQLLFNRKSSKYGDGSRGQIGIPRALNMYENYPFWHRFFSELGFEVVLSDETTKFTNDLGLDTIPAGIICYPAKLFHGHIINLINQGVKRIFMPCIKWEHQEDPGTNNHYNCPIVAGYPDVMLGNIEVLRAPDIEYFHGFLPFDKKRHLLKKLLDVPFLQGISKGKIKRALGKAYEEDESFHYVMRQAGQTAINRGLQDHKPMIVLAGHPYHVDPEVSHGISEIFTRYGAIVLTEDSIAHLAQPERPLRVVDQWTYHARLYRAATVVTQYPDMHLVQLVSFACGLDAVTSDQVQEILESHGKTYTMLKIDEMADPGRTRISARSLLATIAP